MTDERQFASSRLVQEVSCPAFDIFVTFKILQKFNNYKLKI